MSTSIKEKLKAAKRPETTVQVCLRGDLQAEFEQAERELADAERKPADSLAGTGSRAIAERIEALREQMREHTVEFRFRAKSRHEWRVLIDAHPPRRDDDGAFLEEDRYIGVNTATFFEVCIRECLAEPVLDDDDWATLDANLSDRQYDSLFNAAWNINRGEVGVPFSRAASRILSSASE